MAHFSYYLLRGSAIVLGGSCTYWSAHQTWEHSPWDFTGPLAAVAAAALFIYVGHAAKGRQWVLFSVLGVLGLLAAAISSSVVLQRNAENQAKREASAQSGNLPRLAADKALVAAEAELKKASAEAAVECAKGDTVKAVRTKEGGVKTLIIPNTRCSSLTQRETEARARVETARQKVVKAGALTAENPVASVMGGWAETFHWAMAVAPAIWLELAAPALLAFGFAPWPHKDQPPLRKAKRRKKKRPPRKPTPAEAPSAEVLPMRPRRKA
jgi:hypothetical protein